MVENLCTCFACTGPAKLAAAKARVAELEEENEVLSAGHEEVVDAERDHLRARVVELEAALRSVAGPKPFDGPAADANYEYVQRVAQRALKGKGADDA